MHVDAHTSNDGISTERGMVCLQMMPERAK
jgi:hypothetical protein